MKNKINFGNFINGVWFEKSSEESSKVLDKYSGELLAEGTMANDEMIGNSLVSSEARFQ